MADQVVRKFWLIVNDENREWHVLPSRPNLQIHRQGSARLDATMGVCTVALVPSRYQEWKRRLRSMWTSCCATIAEALVVFGEVVDIDLVTGVGQGGRSFGLIRP
jgi:hypothetical protein